MSAISSSVKPKKTRAFAVLEAMLAHVHDEPDVGHWPGLRKGMPFAMVVLPALLRGQRDAGLQKSLRYAITTGEIEPISMWHSLAEHSGPMYSQESRQTQLAWAVLVSIAAPEYVPKLETETKEWAELVSLAWSCNLLATEVMTELCKRHAPVWQAAMQANMHSAARLNVLLPLRGIHQELALDAYRVWSSSMEQAHEAWETLRRHHPEWCARLVDVARTARAMGWDEQDELFSHALTMAMRPAEDTGVNATVRLPELG